MFVRKPTPVQIGSFRHRRIGLKSRLAHRVINVGRLKCRRAGIEQERVEFIARLFRSLTGLEQGIGEIVAQAHHRHYAR